MKVRLTVECDICHEQIEIDYPGLWCITEENVTSTLDEYGWGVDVAGFSVVCLKHPRPVPRATP